MGMMMCAKKMRRCVVPSPIVAQFYLWLRGEFLVSPIPMETLANVVATLFLGVSQQALGHALVRKNRLADGFARQFETQYMRGHDRDQIAELLGARSGRDSAQDAPLSVRRHCGQDSAQSLAIVEQCLNEIALALSISRFCTRMRESVQRFSGKYEGVELFHCA